MTTNMSARDDDDLPLPDAVAGHDPEPAEQRVAAADLPDEDDEVEEGGVPFLPMLETPTLTKAELADLLFERLGLNKRESKDMVEAFFDLIHDTLVAGDDVKLSGFGNFQIRRKAARPGRNPRTGETIPIEARQVVTFHASHKLKALIQGEQEPSQDFE